MISFAFDETEELLAQTCRDVASERIRPAHRAA